MPQQPAFFSFNTILYLLRAQLEVGPMKLTL
jgi:hypothetical protein